MNLEISVILPTFNEAGNISELIDRVYSTLTKTRKSFEIIVVDDNSPDQTWKKVEAIKHKHKSSENKSPIRMIRLIRRIDKRGLTSAIQDGIDAANGKLIGWMDCDLSMPPEKLLEMPKKLNEGYDIVVGSRYVPGGSDHRTEKFQVFLSKTISMISRALLVSEFKDYTSGFILAKRSVLKQIRLNGDYGEYFINLIYRAIKSGFRVVEIPYVLVPRKVGISKTAVSPLGFAIRGRKYLTMVAQLKLGRNGDSPN